MKTCISCGETGNPPDARFCAQCGTPLVAQSIESTSGGSVHAPAATADPVAAQPPIAPPIEPAETQEPPIAAQPEPVEQPADEAPFYDVTSNQQPPHAYQYAAFEQPVYETPAPMLPEAPTAAIPELPPSREARNWAVAAHVTALVGGFMGGLPAFLGPLVVWLIRKDDDAWSAGHSRNALNFNLSVLAYGFALLMLSVVTLGVGLLIAIPGWIFLALGWFALTIVGAIRAAGDQPWRYPLTIRFIK